MVTIVLRGGLGNQLFQYATGRAHSLRTDSPLYADISQLDKDRSPDVAKRSLHLDAFNLPVKYMDSSPTWVVDLKLFERIPRAIDTINKQLVISLFKRYVEDKSKKFDQYVVELPGNITLDGYWQSERYFHEFSKTLRHEICVRNPVSGENKQWYDRISNTSSISVHIRRGDYVSLGWALPPAYYRNALKRICRETGASNLFFFSDNMEWVRGNQQELLPTQSDFDVHYVECNDGDPQEDLRLMRSCDHHVIANSTFSWWGAWLNNKKNKRVFAPNHWIQKAVDKLDIIPERWTPIGW